MNKIVKKYLMTNGIKTEFFANWIGVDSSNAAKWLSGKRNLPKDKLDNVWRFLNGEFLTPFDQIVEVKEDQV